MKLTKHVKVFLRQHTRIIRQVYCASLPSVLFGHNGRLIGTQSEYDAALAELRQILSAVAEVPPVEEWSLWRLDIAWHFDLPARSYVMMHDPLRVPGIRKSASLFDDYHGLAWRGDDSRFCIKFYDKARKMKVDGSILRAEISLCENHLKRRLVGKQWLSLSHLWTVFYETMATIPPIKKPLIVEGFPEALGVLPREMRMAVLAQCQTYMSERTFRRNRARIEAAGANLREDFCWAAYLDKESPPPAINLEKRLRAGSHGIRHGKKIK